MEKEPFLSSPHVSLPAQETLQACRYQGGLPWHALEAEGFKGERVAPGWAVQVENQLWQEAGRPRLSPRSREREPVCPSFALGNDGGMLSPQNVIPPGALLAWHTALLLPPGAVPWKMKDGLLFVLANLLLSAPFTPTKAAYIKQKVNAEGGGMSGGLQREKPSEGLTGGVSAQPSPSRKSPGMEVWDCSLLKSTGLHVSRAIPSGATEQFFS